MTQSFCEWRLFTKGNRKRRRGLVTFVILLCASIALDAEVLIVAHRGASLEAPENTIAAYSRAAELGADYIEVDVRTTADQELVIMHDANVDRTTDGKGAVREYTFDQIRKLNAASKWPPRFGRMRVPTLEEVLAFAKVRGMGVDVDHKDGSIDAIARAIRVAGMVDRVVIEGRVANLEKFVALLPGIATMPKVESPSDVAEVCRRLKTTVVRLSLEQLNQPEYVAAVHRQGARVSVTILRTSDDEAMMRKVISQGAAMIETDHPGVLSHLRKTLAGLSALTKP